MSTSDIQEADHKFLRYVFLTQQQDFISFFYYITYGILFYYIKSKFTISLYQIIKYDAVFYHITLIHLKKFHMFYYTI